VPEETTDEAYDWMSVVRSPGFDSAGLLRPPAPRSEERATFNSDLHLGASMFSMTSGTTVTHAVVSSVRAFRMRAVAEKVRIDGEAHGDAQRQQPQQLRMQQTGETKVKQPDVNSRSSGTDH
jgi:hypothetical protein